MDISNSNVKTPEPESETPARIQPTNNKASPLTNGVLKRHPPLNLHPHPHHPHPHHPLHHHHHHPIVVTYKECLKNHAATMGGHAVDGCGEFMPSPTTNQTDPTSLKCAACGCHRNFHRREPEDPAPHQIPLPLTLPLPAPPTQALEYQPHHRHHPPPPPRGNSTSPNNSPSPPPISSTYYPSAPHMLLALSHGLDSNSPNPTAQFITSSGSSRKRHRTKFTSDQKEKMLEFADKVGWKMQKRDEDLISGFCGEIGVDKSVFKVWMHNNKNTFGKKELQFSDSANIAISTPPTVAAGNNGNGVNYGAVEGNLNGGVHENSTTSAVHGSAAGGGGGGGTNGGSSSSS